MQIKIGVIGTGAMGMNHIQVLSKLNNDCELVGVYDIDFKRAEAVAQANNIKAYSTLEELLSTVNAAVIAVPVDEHYKVARKCLEQEVHVLIEKPITQSIDEAYRLKKMAEHKNIKIQVGHIELFNPTIKVLKKIIENEDIIAIDIDRLSPYSERWNNVDVITDLMIHDLYILNYIIGSPPIICKSFGRVIHQKLNHVVVNFLYKDGLIATLSGSQVTEKKVRKIQVITRNAYIIADLINRKIVISRSNNFFKSNQVVDYKQENILENVFVPSSDPLRDELLHFVYSIQRNTRPKISTDEGIEALEMVELVHTNMINSSGEEE